MSSPILDRHAVLVALELHTRPTLVDVIVGQDLPRGVLDLIKLAGGSPEVAARWAASTGLGPAALQESAVFFVEQVLMHRNADLYRVLGVRQNASEAKIRLHHRWLMHWLHPDRYSSGWHAVFSERVNSAYAVLKNVDKRASYDAEIAAQTTQALRETTAPVGQAPVHATVRPAQRRPPVRRSGRAWVAIMATAAIAVGGGIGLWWWLAQTEEEGGGPGLVIALSPPAAQTPEADRTQGLPRMKGESHARSAGPDPGAPPVTLEPVPRVTAASAGPERVAAASTAARPRSEARAARGSPSPVAEARAAAELVRRALEEGDLTAVLNLLAQDGDDVNGVHLRVARDFEGMREALRAEDGVAMEEVAYGTNRYTARYSSSAVRGARNAPYVAVDFARGENAWLIEHVGTGTAP